MSEPIPQHEALRFQLAMIAGNEPATSQLEIRWKVDRMARRFVGVRDVDQAADTIQELARRADVYVGAAPRVREGGTAQDVERCWCLWADLDGLEALEMLRQFRPLPTILVRTGTEGHAHAWWPLREPITGYSAERANRRLALKLGGDRASTDRARIMRPAGTLNHKHDPPQPVTCTRLELDAFTVAEVVGDLPDDPVYKPRPLPAPAHRNAGGSIEGLLKVAGEAREGNRNAALFWAACKLREDGIADAANVQALRQAAMSTGLSEQEVNRTLASGLNDRRAAA